MLCLKRRHEETIYIGKQIRIKVLLNKAFLSNKAGTATSIVLGIDAPKEMKILRGELLNGKITTHTSCGKKRGKLAHKKGYRRNGGRTTTVRYAR